MAQIPSLVTMSLALALLPVVTGEPKPFAHPLVLINADRGTAPVARDEAIRKLVDQCTEVSRLVKKDPSPTNRAMLEKLHRNLERLVDEQTEELFPAAQTEEVKQAEEPSDIYFQAWLLCRDAEKSKTEGHFAASREKLEKAVELFEQIVKEHPGWKPQMVQARLAKTKEDLSSLPHSGD